MESLINENKSELLDRMIKVVANQEEMVSLINELLKKKIQLKIL